ncbi:MAG: protein translocase subunit SecD [Dehalococcoidia bacterium]|nr:protein translocase subunit SecD [Dehalococcoidia bacterium]
MRKNSYLLIFILVLFGFALWSVLPLDRSVFGRDGLSLGLDLKGGSYLVYQADLSQVEPGSEAEIMEGVKGVIGKRINALGISEPIIEIQKEEGNYSIGIQLPGISDIEKAKEMIGRTALLVFREQDQDGNWIPATATVDGEELTLSSKYFKENTYVRVTEYGAPLLIFNWDETGQKLSEEITGRLIDQPLGIYIGDEPLRGKDGHPIAPIVRDVIRESGQIDGLNLEDAQELSKLLNAGRMPVSLGRWVEEDGNKVFQADAPLYEKTVDATLGTDSINKSILAAIIGIAILLLFMILYYRFLGIVACLSLIIYGAVALSIFKIIPITLTLPGIAGFIVSLGMAVDANVLIFERTKEELRGGRSVGAAIEAGFNRAWTAIRDSNITTFIACIVLFWLGGSLGALMVRGFAVTLFIGVALSMFSAIIITRTLLRLTMGKKTFTDLKAYGVRK